VCGDVKLLIRNCVGEFGLAAYAGTQMYLSINAIPFLVSCSLNVNFATLQVARRDTKLTFNLVITYNVAGAIDNFRNIKLVTVHWFIRNCQCLLRIQYNKSLIVMKACS